MLERDLEALDDGKERLSLGTVGVCGAKLKVQVRLRDKQGMASTHSSVVKGGSPSVPPIRPTGHAIFVRDLGSPKDKSDSTITSRPSALNRPEWLRGAPRRRVQARHVRLPPRHSPIAASGNTRRPVAALLPELRPC